MNRFEVEGIVDSVEKYVCNAGAEKCNSKKVTAEQKAAFLAADAASIKKLQLKRKRTKPEEQLGTSDDPATASASTSQIQG